MIANPEGVETTDHDKVFAHVSALQLPRKKVRHEAPDEIAAVADHLSNDVVFQLIPPRHRNVILPHNFEHMTPMAPLVLLDLLHPRDLIRIPKRPRMTDVGKGRRLFSRVCQA